VVEGVPYRGIFGSRTISLPIFLAGYAGESHGALRGGQALLVMFEITDRFGNPVPVTGPKARTVAVTVHGDQAGSVPPFVVTSNDGGNRYRYGAPKAASPLGPGTLSAPVGIHAFYFVPGIPSPTRDLSSDVSTLKRQLEAFGETLLTPPLIPRGGEADMRLSIHVEIDRQRFAELRGIQLIEPGTFAPQPDPIAKWAKWMLFSEVTDLETFKAEVGVSVIPLLGDGRDIAVYMFNYARGRTQGIWDNLVLTFAAVGLLSDLGLIHPVAIAANVFAASGKAFVKAVRRIPYATGKMANALWEFLAPLRSAVDNATSADAKSLARVVDEVEALAPLLGFVSDSVRTGTVSRLRARLDRLVRFVESPGCNPASCLVTINSLHRERIAAVLDHVPFALPQLHNLAWSLAHRGGIKQVDDAAIYTLHLHEQVGKSVANILDIVLLLDEPVALLKRIADLPPASLEAARPLFASPIFTAVAKQDAQALRLLLRAFESHGPDAAVIFRHALRSEKACNETLDLVRMLSAGGPTGAHQIDDLVGVLVRATKAYGNAVPELIGLMKNPYFDVVGGEAGLRSLVSVLDRLSTRGGGQAMLGGPHQQTLEIARQIVREVSGKAASGRYLTFDDMGAVFANLGPQRFETYIRSIRVLQTLGHDTRGIISYPVWKGGMGATEEANRGAIRNFHRVATQGAGAVHFAAEVVVAAWLVERRWAGLNMVVLKDGRKVPFTKLVPSIADAQLSAFGRKMPVGKTVKGVQRTLEGDIIAAIGGKEVFFDLKNYQGDNINLLESDLIKAIDGINRNAQIETVVFVAPGRWSKEARETVAKAHEKLRRRIGGVERDPKIILAELEADEELLDFLRHHVDAPD
jgi:hypothetical protein